MSRKPKFDRKLIASRSFMSVYQVAPDQRMITFHGNMGATVSKVGSVFDAEFGEGAFFKARMKMIREEGTPDYEYFMLYRDEA